MKRFVISILVLIGVVVRLGFLLSAMPVLRTQDQKEDQEQKEKEKKKLADQLPAGEGKEIVIAACTQCHNLALVMASRKDARSWVRTVEDMVSRGASLLPDESDTLVKYLAANFGPLININKASVPELATLPSIGTKLDEAIVRYREKNGQFQKIEDVAKVEGLTAETLREIKDRISTVSTKETREKK